MNRSFLCLKNKRGFTLAECLVSVLLLSVLALSVTGSFFISRLAVERARHRKVAMELLKQYMEQEVQIARPGAGRQPYTPGDNLYATLTAGPVNIVVGGITYTVSRDPDPSGDPLDSVQFLGSSRGFKAIGFVATWQEDVFAAGVGPICTERLVTYIAQH